MEEKLCDRLRSLRDALLCDEKLDRLLRLLGVEDLGCLFAKFRVERRKFRSTARRASGGLEAGIISREERKREAEKKRRSRREEKRRAKPRQEKQKRRMEKYEI